MAKLGAWLKQEGMSHADFAKAVDVDKSNVTRWVSGEVRPGWEVLPRIIKATRGEVTANDFLPDAQSSGQVNGAPSAPQAA